MQAVSKINFPGWVGVGVVGLYENKANSARPAGAGAGAWLSLAKIKCCRNSNTTTTQLKRSTSNKNNLFKYIFHKIFMGKNLKPNNV